MLSAGALARTRLLLWIFAAGLLAGPALALLPLHAADGPPTAPVVPRPASTADEEDETDEPATLEPAIVPPGERPFWEAVLLMSSDEPDKQKLGRERLIEAADLEYPPAQAFLGECYLRGQDGFSKNERKAASWFLLAANRGEVTASVYLGTCHLFGRGVPKDRAKARAALQQAVDAAASYARPQPPAWFGEEREKNSRPSGRIAREGRDGPVAMAPPVAPWEILLARGHYILGTMLEEDSDYVGALALFEKAAAWGEGGRAGVYEAAQRAARAYALGRGCPRDLDHANAMLERSRDLLRANTMAEIHSMWTDRKVDDFDLADLEKLSGQFADAQFTEDQQDVAASLVKDNPAEARRWCEMAAEAGEVWAMVELGEMLRLGRVGAPDAAAGFAWYAKAAEGAKSWVAIANLVVCYKRGLGTPVDEAAAARLVEKYGQQNYACALAGAGLAPAKAWSAGDWWSLLEQKAKAENLPVAVFHRARVWYWQIVGNEVAPRDLSKVQKQTVAEMKRAAAGGVAEAHFYLGQMYFYYWSGTPSPSRPWVEYEAGAALGDLLSMIEFSMVVVHRDPEDGLRRAIALSRQVLARDPDNASAHNNLAIWLEKAATSQLTIDGFPGLRAASIEHLERAEELGLAVAAKNLAVRYAAGDGVARDLRMAYTYFQSAAEKGDVASNRVLGRMHEMGEGVPVTPREAMYYYRIAALGGDIEALESVCDFYLNGRGVERDLEAAKVWLTRLAQTGHLDGLIAFGDVLMTQQRYVEARKLWVQLSNSNNGTLVGAASERLSRIYRVGLGVKANPRKAEKYFRAALELRDPDALCRQGRDLIVAGKVAEGVVVLEESGDSSGEALFLLGSVRVAGQGMPKDVATGLENFRQASQLGHLNAKYMLAVATLKNLPGAPDLDEAARLLEEAEAAGFSKAAELRPTIEAKRAKAAGAPADAGRAGSG